LLLRTFGFRKRTERLFDTIAERWRFHGPVLIIGGADLAVRTINPADYLRFLTRRLSDRFVKTDVDLQRNLDRLDNLPDPDGRYRVNELFCRDDTWHSALVALLDRADVVLMDLRGFGGEHQGCLFELERLVERGPVGYMFLTVDGTTDRWLLDQTIQDAWNRLDDLNRRPGAADLNVLPIQKATSRAMDTILVELQGDKDAAAAAFRRHSGAIAAFAAVATVLLMGLVGRVTRPDASLSDTAGTSRSSLADWYTSSRAIYAAASQEIEAGDHYNRAVSLHQSGDYDGAIQEYRKTLALSPDRAEAHHNIGVIFDRKGDYDQAIVEYRRLSRPLPCRVGPTIISASTWSGAVSTILRSRNIARR